MKGMNSAELIEKLQKKLDEILIIIYKENDIEKIRERIEEIVNR